MKKTDEPGWPMTGGLPFMPFPVPGVPAPTPPSLLDGMGGGMDLIRDFWGKLPGATPVPGFLVPTVNVEELDKRIADLRSAEKWVEVNLELLRTTIQGLEVQRHTIAAIHSLSTMAERPVAAAAAVPTAKSAAEPSVPAAAGAADQWLGYLQDQFVRVAGAAVGAASPKAVPARKRAAGKTAGPKTSVAGKRRKKIASPAR